VLSKSYTISLTLSFGCLWLVLRHRAELGHVKRSRNTISLAQKRKCIS